ncbi:MAG: OmpP1/FadL family transporter [Flavobacteriales bacterium]
MKKIITPLVILVTLSAHAQSFLDDAIDLSSENINGTARYRAMGGSMGALGNDLSAVQQLNPAGGAVSVRSHGTVTLGVSSYENETNSTGKMNNSRTIFNMTQLGGGFVFENENMNSNWKRFALTMGYSRDNNLNRQINVAPYSADFIYEDAYYFEEINGDVNSYTGEFLYDGESVSVNGFNDKYSLEFSTNYNDQIYLGVGLGFHGSQKEVFQMVERSNQTEEVKNDKFLNYYQDGRGFSLNLGIIAKVTDELRLGFAYHSPTWWSIQEESWDYEEFDGVNVPYGEPFGAYQEYTISTPSKLVASGALVLGKNLAINADAIFKDYSNINFGNMVGGNEVIVNENVNSELRDTWEFRVGTEYRIEAFRIRGGYRYMEDPYKDLDGNFSTYSLGLGYDFGKIFLDGSYDYTEGNTAFRTSGGATGTYVNQDLNRSNFIVTLGYKF